MSNQTTEIIVSGTFMYPNLQQPNALSNKYQIDICRLSKEDVAKLDAVGINVKDAADKGREEDGKYITATSKYPIATVDSQNQPLSPDISVGNGSTGRVRIRPYNWSFQKKSGISAGAQAVQVLDLVEYNPGGGFDAVDGGFVVASETF